MNLSKKKALAARTLNVGEKRIVFLQSRLNEIKEAITKQDIRDLQKEGAIVIKEVKGRRKTIKKSGKRSTGNVRMVVNRKKQVYVMLTRKLRKDIWNMKKQRMLQNEEIEDIRKKIRNRFFKSKAHLKKYVGDLKK